MPISSAGTSQNESIHAKAPTHVYTAAYIHAVPHADLHSLPNVHAKASTHVYTAACIHAVPHADLHSLPNVHAKASADLNP